MKLMILMSLFNPMTWLLAMMIVVVGSRIFGRKHPKQRGREQSFRFGIGSPEAVGSAFLFLSMAYRPDHAFIAKAQIQQHEDADEDDQGGPDTPQKHLMRQLRKIRRGEPVEKLVLRLE
jgi:hypothetical protein